MRGATRIQVIGLLALSGALTGALVGFATGLLPVPSVPALAIVAAALDLLRVPVPSIRRQVPQYWGRIFDPRATAALYGARLGVGPLTILPTWLWWAAVALGAAEGPWVGALTGTTFAVVRTATMVAAGTRARAMDGADRSLRLGVALVVAVVALAGCSDDDDEPEAEPAATTIELERSTTTTTTPEDTELAALLLEEALPGLERMDDEVMDLDAAAEAEQDVEAERALLETRGFERGVARRWLGPDDDVVYLAAYELGSSQQADLYLLDGVETLTARSAEQFEVPDVPGAVGFTTREEGFVAHAVAFTRDARWFLVLVGSSDGSRTSADALGLATEQAARL